MYGGQIQQSQVVHSLGEWQADHLGNTRYTNMIISCFQFPVLLDHEQEEEEKKKKKKINKNNNEKKEDRKSYKSITRNTRRKEQI